MQRKKYIITYTLAKDENNRIGDVIQINNPTLLLKLQI